jgi:hypothetical protein
VVKDYTETGLPAYLDFELPADAKYFTLEVNGTRTHQAIVDGFAPPASTGAPVMPATPEKKEEMVEALPVDDATGADAEWKNLPLEFRKDQTEKPDVDLDHNKD